ncbi:MAG: sigma-E factor negative regulatory protein [Rhodospirillaceae bacterium]
MEQISALIDGELESEESGRQLNRVKQDLQLRETWDTYHMIGDVLRGSAVLSPSFDRRVAQRLAEEPTILAPQRTMPRRMSPKVSYALSAAASLSAVAAVAWVALSGNVVSTGEQQGQLAQAPATAGVAPVVATVSIPETVRPHDYLLAHQGVSPSTALQGVAPYVRTVTMTPQIDGR